jgi:hypothetical protein
LNATTPEGSADALQNNENHMCVREDGIPGCNFKAQIKGYIQPALPARDWYGISLVRRRLNGGAAKSTYTLAD